jgi:hypothetical protein
VFNLEKGLPREFWQKNLQDLDSILLKPISIVFFANLLTQSLEDIAPAAFALFLRHSLEIVINCYACCVKAPYEPSRQ